MAKVEISIDLNVPAERVWKLIGGFHAMPQWHPAVANSEQKSEGGKTLRQLSLAGGGGMIVKRLERQDVGARPYSYVLLQGPLPIANYRAELRVREAQQGKGCTVHWLSEFAPAGAPETEAVNIVRGPRRLPGRFR